VTRIFTSLAVLGNLALLAVFWLGWSIGDDPLSVETRDQMATHFRWALACGPIALLVHSVAFTYFMGTGRWIEETSEAYKLGSEFRNQNVRLKYGILPGMMVWFLLLMATGALGAITDPTSNAQMAHSKLIHFTLAIATILVNLLVTWAEWRAIAKNGALVDSVMDNVRRIRREKGLDN
jgi:hypothetical protein